VAGVTIYLHQSYVRALKKFAKLEQSEINAAIARLPEIIGNPHQHSGAGVRRLRPSIFEIRAGLRLRIVFTIRTDNIFLHTVGDHDHVRAWIKQNL
jgi:mRNA-degrading endonuclease RelE of RelBE toxin-antitoxin system